MVRVRRMVTAESEVPRMTAGTIRCARFPSGSSRNGTNIMRGDHPHQIDGNTMIMVPIQKLGTASIRMEKERPM